MPRGQTSDRPCGNPLYAEWLHEWMEELQSRNAKAYKTYRTAWQSMKACPITFEHPSEAEQLHGIGPAISAKLIKKLKKHCEESGLPMPLEPAKRRAAKRAREVAEATQNEIEVTFEDEPQTTKKKKRDTVYVPRVRSGAYAILIALSKMDPNAPRGLTKPEVQELAQPYCDASMTVPDDPTKFYTAWKSVHTLIDKDLVEERGRPQKRYMLTESGWVLARGLVGRLDGQASTSNDVSRDSGSPVLAPATASSAGFTSRPASAVAAKQKHNNAPTSTVSKSASSGSGRRSAAAEAAALAAERRRLAVVQEAAIANLPEDLIITSDSDLEILSPPTASIAPAISAISRPVASNPALKKPATLLPNEALPFEPIMIPPSAYTIELIIDNREVRSRKDRDYIQDELARKGVAPITRPLEVGDALWVAVVHDQSLRARYGDEVGPEIMLDWIIERKRSDDLISSIKDGRFLEQKFRLHKSGVQNVVYVVENINLGEQQKDFWDIAMNTAIAATQVTNEFFVKRTTKLDETISYLARLTMHIRLLYAGKPLRLIPSDALNPRTYLPLLKSLNERDSETAYNITLQNFSSLASKSETVTLRDQFLKFLMCIKGISGDKALSIARKWPTPNSFLEAYRQCEPGKRQVMVKEGTDVYNVGRKMVGKALSEKVCEVWGEGA